MRQHKRVRDPFPWFRNCSTGRQTRPHPRACCPKSHWLNSSKSHNRWVVTVPFRQHRLSPVYRVSYHSQHLPSTLRRDWVASRLSSGMPAVAYIKMHCLSRQENMRANVHLQMDTAHFMHWEHWRHLSPKVHHKGTFWKSHGLCIPPFKGILTRSCSSYSEWPFPTLTVPSKSFFNVFNITGLSQKRLLAGTVNS